MRFFKYILLILICYSVSAIPIRHIYPETDVSRFKTPVAFSQEETEDIIGDMVSGNTETYIDVTYDDSNAKLDFVVDLNDIDDHEQYLYADGSRALAGAWDMNSHSLSNVNIDSGTVDGITSFTVANSIDIGNYTLTANGLTIDGTFTDGTMSISGGAITGATNTNWDAAYGWGDHASGGYLKADGTVALAGAWNMASQATTNVNIDTGNIATAVTQTEWDAAYAHVSSNGTDHTYIDQDVTSGTAPTFSATNFSDGGTNAIVTTTQESNWDTHLTSTGADHTYINQAVTTNSSPTFSSLTVSNNMSVDALSFGSGDTDSIESSTGQVDFTNEDIVTTGSITGETLITSSSGINVNGGTGSLVSIKAQADNSTSGFRIIDKDTTHIPLFAWQANDVGVIILRNANSNKVLLGAGENSYILDYNLGLNTTGPGKKLEINTGAATDGMRICYNDGNGSASTYSDFLLNSSGDLTITATGGDISFSNENLTTTGTVEAATITEGGNAVYNSSDTPSGELGGTYAAITIDDGVSVSNWVLTTPTITSGATFTDADISPDAAGELVYDNTVTGLLDGAFAWYDDDAIRYFVDLATLPSNDDYVVAYDADADGFYMKEDSTGGAFGSYTNLDDDNNAHLPSHAYKANQDGYVVATGTANGNFDSISIYIDETNDPAGAGDLIAKQHTAQDGADAAVGSVPVKSGLYWEVLSDCGSTTIRWFPNGTLVKCTDQD